MPARRFSHHTDSIGVYLDRRSLAAQILHGGLQVVDALRIGRALTSREAIAGRKRDVALLCQKRTPESMVRSGAPGPPPAMDQEQGWIGTGSRRAIEIAEQRLA